MTVLEDGAAHVVDAAPRISNGLLSTDERIAEAGREQLHRAEVVPPTHIVPDIDYDSDATRRQRPTESVGRSALRLRQMPSVPFLSYA